MKYACLFAVVSLLLLKTVMDHAPQNPWVYFCLWPCLSFLLVALAYAGLGPRVFGKQQSGTLPLIRQCILLPYLVYLWSVWHLLHLIKKEDAYNEINENIIIGRRLLNGELPEQVKHVVDLTTEFSEVVDLRSKQYYSFQILDGSVPQLSDLQQWVKDIASINEVIYIHCAEGHGRTGLFTCALLIERGLAKDAAHALSLLQTQRPLARLGSKQLALLERFAQSAD